VHRASQPVIEIDAFFGDAEPAQLVALHAELVGVGGATGVADQGLTHDRELDG
jgi:hypothetical protein